ncbi:MAG: 2-phospho-L-lactate transferase [Paracoccaceae bacterium]|nr:2-phospho-L-lactate transferase [Paracoccaceae bacterium]MDG1737167.1 2-phospho-L-lactate transferase [Paracoccaceae bacterium]MDG2260260.1 2-phospho-L-lactate transferase [Paracoccaceae bacterium]
MSKKVVTLSGGVGGAKLVQGLSHVVAGADLIVACNTGDDFDHLGLRVCPDIDSVLYALGGLSDQERGWGRRDETWTFMAALKGIGGPDWFNLGDGDLATHVVRTDALRQGKSLSDVTAALAQGMGVKANVLPMSDDPVATIVQTENGDLEFQQYFVGQQCKPEVTGFVFENIADARPQAQILAALDSNPRAAIIAPSNPYVSVNPILDLPGMRAAMAASKSPIVAVSPIIGGQAVKGPAAKMMAELGKDVSVLGIAQHYQGLINGLVIDEQDAQLAQEIEGMGIATCVTPTLMSDVQSKKILAEVTLDFAERLAT